MNSERKVDGSGNTAREAKLGLKSRVIARMMRRMKLPMLASTVSSVSDGCDDGRALGTAVANHVIDNAFQPVHGKHKGHIWN